MPLMANLDITPLHLFMSLSSPSPLLFLLSLPSAAPPLLPTVLQTSGMPRVWTTFWLVSSWWLTQRSTPTGCSPATWRERGLTFLKRPWWRKSVSVCVCVHTLHCHGLMFWLFQFWSSFTSAPSRSHHLTSSPLHISPSHLPTPSPHSTGEKTDWGNWPGALPVLWGFRVQGLPLLPQVQELGGTNQHYFRVTKKCPKNVINSHQTLLMNW